MSVRAHSGWYDITVTESGAGESGTPYRRRWSGHLENGRPSTSDPGPHGS